MSEYGHDIADCYQPLLRRLRELEESKGKKTSNFIEKDNRILKIKTNYTTDVEENYKLLCFTLDKIVVLLNASYPGLDKIEANLEYLPNDDSIKKIYTWEDQYYAELDFYKEELEKMINDILPLLNFSTTFTNNPVKTDFTVDELAGLFGLMDKTGIIKLSHGQKTALSKVLLDIFQTKQGAASFENFRNKMYDVDDKTAGDLEDKLDILKKELKKI